MKYNINYALKEQLEHSERIMKNKIIKCWAIYTMIEYISKKILQDT